MQIESILRDGVQALMFNTLANMLSELFDTTFAPADAFTTGDMSGTPSSDVDVAWHNGFGTLNAYEVPASSCTTDDPLNTW